MSGVCKSAIVTGGSRGIGRAVVEQLAGEGYFVAFSYNSGAGAAAELVEALGADRVMAFQWAGGEDVSVFEPLLHEIKGRGFGIDLLVNNAGITRDGYFALSPAQDFREVLDVNLVGLAAATRACIRPMIGQKRGVVVNLSSIAASMGTEGQTAYSASKAGISAFTKSLGREVGKYGVRVVCLAPGFVETDMFGKIPLQQRKAMIDRVPLKRPGRASEMAGIVSFLASDAASYIHGTTIVADGGVS